MRRSSRYLIAIAMALAMTAPTVLAQSQATLVPSISISTVHDENIFSSPSAVGDLVTALRPSLEGRYESPKTDLQSLLSFDMQRSTRHSLLNTLDARRQAMFDGHFRSTPMIVLGLGARYDRTETPGDLNLDTGIMLDRQIAQRVQATPSLAYRPTPTTTISTQYDWTNEILARVFDADLHAARVGAAWRVTPLTTWNVQYLGRLFEDRSQIRADQPAVHRSHAALLGWTRELGPGTNLSVQAGPRFRSERGVSAEVATALLRRTPYTRFLLDYWRGETIVLGIVGPVEIQSGSMKWSWTLRRSLDIGTALAVFRSITIDDREALVYHGSLVAAWSREPYIIAVSYGTDLQQGNIRTDRLADERVRRGVFLVRMTIAPRLSRAFRKPEDGGRPTTPLKGVLP